jgi:formamidopyrimidine-DNA glycosylase
MPEGPEAYLNAKDLNTEVAEKVLYSIDIIFSDEKKKYLDIKNKDKFLSKLPLNIRSVTARGKKVVWHLYDNEGNKFWLIFGLALTGIFQKQPKDHSDFILNIVKKGKLKIDENIDDIDLKCLGEDIYIKDTTVYFDDMIKYGNIYFCMNKDEKDYVFKDTGFDLMQYALTRDDDRQVLRMFWKSLNEKRRKNMKICKYLREQKFFAGPGNYIIIETLWKVRIHPGRLLGTITKEESDNICLTLLETLKESYDKGGAHLKDFYRFNGEESQFKCIIYQKEKQKKRNEEETEGIIKDKFDPLGNQIKWIRYEDKKICYYTDIQK